MMIPLESRFTEVQMSSRRTRSLTDYCRAAMRHKLLLVSPSLVLMIAVGVALSKVPDLYRSTALISTAKLKASESELPILLGEVRQQVTSHEATETLIANSVLHKDSHEEAVRKTSQRINVEPDKPSGSIAISYRAEDPETARSGAEELTNRLVNHNVKDSPPPDSSLELLRKQAADISSRLRELERREPRLAGDEDYVAAPFAQSARSPQPSAEFIRAQQMTIEGLKDQQYKFQQELAEVERRIAEQRKIVEQQSKGSTLRDNPTYAALVTRRTELQGQRDTLINRQELTDKHPRVLAINDQIAAINRQIEELRQQDAALVSQSPEARELASLLSERNRVKIELEVTDRELARRSLNQPVTTPTPQPVRRDTAPSSLAREYSSLKRNERDIAAEIQELEAKSGQAPKPAATQFQLVKPANLPTSPVSPNRPLLISLAIALGLSLGAFFVLMAESRRFNSLQDVRDVEFYTRLPLLATIPKTLTPAERRSQRWRTKARLLFGVAATVVVTVGLTQFFILSGIFSLITKK
jgi:capsular polysaccharide biosynthesis protein